MGWNPGKLSKHIGIELVTRVCHKAFKISESLLCVFLTSRNSVS